jgi:SAM-dependent methyltransferase
MYAFKYDSIAHAEHDILCPMPRSRVEYLVEAMALKRDARVLDLAAGKGELFIRILERYGCSGDAVEPSPLFQAAMRAEVRNRLEPDRVKLIEQEPFELEFEPESYDAVVCLASRPFGDLRETFARSWAMVRTGGLLLLGEWHWNDSELEYDYLEALGCSEDTYLTHDDLIALAAREDFTPMYAGTASRQDIDHYEGQTMLAVERWLRANPGDPIAPAVRERARKWRDAYLKWGRYELGFGMYLFLK